MSDLRLATRASPLAIRQATIVQERLRDVGVVAVLVPVDSAGDLDRSSALSQIGGQGVFAIAVQRLVLDGDADVAVHSAKDLPSSTPDGLVIAAVPERRDAADVLVGRSLAGLGPGATVATGSPRRRALMLELRPDLNMVELRGNMATRLRAAGRDGVDAIVTAMAALERLGQDDLVAERLDPMRFVPQVGQGALALECRDDDDTTRETLSRIDTASHRALEVERDFLRELGAGCAIPAGAYAFGDESLEVVGVMAALDGSIVLRATSGPVSDASDVGVALARRLRDDLGGASLDGWAS